MPRPARSETEILLREARALEILADEAEVPPSRLQEYWQVAADLINLVADIEQYRVAESESGGDEERLLALRRRAREVAARLSELTPV